MIITETHKKEFILSEHVKKNNDCTDHSFKYLFNVKTLSVFRVKRYSYTVVLIIELKINLDFK